MLRKARYFSETSSEVTVLSFALVAKVNDWRRCHFFGDSEIIYGTSRSSNRTDNHFERKNMNTVKNNSIALTLSAVVAGTAGLTATDANANPFPLRP